MYSPSDTTLSDAGSTKSRFSDISDSRMRLPIRAKYRHSQIEPYLDHIRVPVNDRPSIGVEHLSPRKQLEILKLLTKCHLCNVPFENLTLHYSWHRVIEVDPQVLYSKIIETPGRGGYCMENNTLFNTLLVTLGFEAYMAGSRVYQANLGKYDGFSHCVNIVTIAEEQYLVDVGFGANGPNQPIKLDPNSRQAHKYMGDMEVRVRFDAIPQATNRRGKYWIYEYRHDIESEWDPLYCFTDFEFLPEDIRILNLAPSVLPTSIFRKNVICTRFTTVNDFKVANGRLEVLTRWDADDEEINGVLILSGRVLKLRTEGKIIFEMEFKNEYERVRALSKYFGIKLSEVERHAIRGCPTEILQRD
ncbi:arylamine N-acetyltransferase 1 [Mariannaea sp. PMI_226]|nr:arylamine N-acetyltransferase 1 [Mariannaea sp. PMI_226]